MESKIISLKEALAQGDPLPGPEWQVRIVRSEECLSYLAWNTRTLEGLVIDPKEEDWAAYQSLLGEQPGVIWKAVIDTHTHADHVSIAAKMAARTGAPLVMHQAAPSHRVDLRVCRTTAMPSQASPILLVCTPGHTPDSLSVVWGPFLFTGDTILFGDTGRDDLPGGDAVAHFESLEELKKHVRPEMIVLPGHDNKGGRASTWSTQVKVNPSLTQGREDFIREASAFDGPAPRLLKKSLAENFR